MANISNIVGPLESFIEVNGQNFTVTAHQVKNKLTINTNTVDENGQPIVKEFDGSDSVTIDIPDVSSFATEQHVSNNYAKKDDIPEITNSLTSDSTTDALSAGQGKVLDEKIVRISTDLTDLSSAVASNYALKSELFSKNYDDLTNTPPIPTKTSLELDNVSNDAQVKRSEMGVANGVATLGADGKVPTDQLPTNLSNQSAFSNIAVSGQTPVAADTATDTLTLIAGANVTITTNATDDSITIAATGGSEPPDLSSYATKEYVDGAVTNLEEVIPTRTGQLTNDSGYLTSIPVTMDSGDTFTTITISKEEPKGGAAGDIWFKY